MKLVKTPGLVLAAVVAAALIKLAVAYQQGKSTH